MMFVKSHIQIRTDHGARQKMADPMTINRISIGRITLMFSFYFNFIVSVSANIWYSINLAILLSLKPV